ncbi:hypothetical protein [Streptomyces silvensis]|uniref:Uncharacterized protein n=1 Tax=Streptomyces silvensis TaxID=1765722 RepID=A0A0W7X3R7_9ACTN|nr:hypothetical protein [Streptomyces silvensis]KUF17330.1 hypothetical protein AT728_16095 [Streptomyces silvensis]
MTPEQNLPKWRPGDALDYAALRRSVDEALAMLPPPDDGDIVFTGGQEPATTPELIDVLVSELTGLLVPCQLVTASWEPEPQAMVETMMHEAHALIERRPVAPNAEQAYDYLQALARATRALAVLAYPGR